MEKHKERKRACVPLQGAVSIETSYISFDDCFAALQIDLCVRGWIEGLWRNRRLHHSHQFPNYVRSIREISHTLSKNAVYYTLSPPQKQAARKLSQWKQDSATRNRYYRGTCKTLQIREGQRPRCPRFAAVRATRTLPLPGFASVSIIFVLTTFRRSRFRQGRSFYKAHKPHACGAGLAVTNFWIYSFSVRSWR